MQLSDDVIEDVKQMILATKHTSGGTGLTAYLVDVDLSILGTTPELFDDYEENVKKEYVPAVTTDEGFQAGRLAFLQGMLKRKEAGGFIFSTPEFRTGGWDAVAVLNIKRSIEKLAAAAPV
jgi:predicted metal-dependent HD superfamily phosphohydrolase